MQFWFDNTSPVVKAFKEFLTSFFFHCKIEFDFATYFFSLCKDWPGFPQTVLRFSQ